MMTKTPDLAKLITQGPLNGKTCAVLIAGTQLDRLFGIDNMFPIELRQAAVRYLNDKASPRAYSRFERWTQAIEQTALQISQTEQDITELLCQLSSHHSALLALRHVMECQQYHASLPVIFDNLRQARDTLKPSCVRKRAVPTTFAGALLPEHRSHYQIQRQALAELLPLRLLHCLPGTILALWQCRVDHPRIRQFYLGCAQAKQLARQTGLPLTCLPLHAKENKLHAQFTAIQDLLREILWLWYQLPEYKELTRQGLQQEHFDQALQSCDWQQLVVPDNALVTVTDNWLNSFITGHNHPQAVTELHSLIALSWFSSSSTGEAPSVNPYDGDTPS